MSRKERAVFGSRVSVVGKDHAAAVIGRADNSARRLKNSVHSGVGIGVIVAALAFVFVIISQNIALVGKPGESRSHDDRSDQQPSGQVNSLGERSPQHAKANAKLAAIVLKRRQKFLHTRR